MWLAGRRGALRRAAECGQRNAWLQLAEWYERPAWGEPDYELADEALRQALDHQVPGAGLQLGRLRWFRRRNEATDAEKAQGFEMVAALVKEDPENDEAAYLLGLMTFGLALLAAVLPAVRGATRVDAAAALRAD